MRHACDMPVAVLAATGGDPAALAAKTASRGVHIAQPPFERLVFENCRAAREVIGGLDHLLRLDSQSLPVRLPKRLSLGNRHKLVFHGSHFRP